MMYAKLAAILVSVIGLFALGYHFGEMPYRTKYEALQAANWEERAKGEEAAKNAIAAQLVDARRAAATNAQISVDLANENAHIAADRDANLALARRLLNGQAHRASSSSGVSQAANQPRAPPAGDAGPPTKAEGLVADAADGYERCVNQLNALIAEVKPQL